MTFAAVFASGEAEGVPDCGGGHQVSIPCQMKQVNSILDSHECTSVSGLPMLGLHMQQLAVEVLVLRFALEALSNYGESIVLLPTRDLFTGRRPIVHLLITSYTVFLPSHPTDSLPAFVPISAPQQAYRHLFSLSRPTRS